MIDVDVDVVKLIVMSVEVELILKGLDPFSIEAAVDVVVGVFVDAVVEAVADVVGVVEVVVVDVLDVVVM